MPLIDIAWPSNFALGRGTPCWAPCLNLDGLTTSSFFFAAFSKCTLPFLKSIQTDEAIHVFFVV